MKLAGRIRGIRKRRSISQKKLSEMSGVSYGSIKRFETTGQISLLSLTKLAFALNEVDTEFIYGCSVSKYSGGYQ